MQGNVLSLYDESANQTDLVKQFLEALKFDFQLVNATFFISTPSITDSKKLQTMVADAGLKHTFLYVEIFDGSFIKGTIDAATLRNIRKIFAAQ